MSTEETQTIQDIEIQFTNTYQQSEKVVQLLRAFKTELTNSKVFDKDDVMAVQREIDQYHNQDVERYRQLSMERLRLLKTFDDQLDLAKNHPVLNKYFVQKQQEIMKVLSTAGK